MNGPRRQRGITLVVSLLMLAVLTLLATAAIQGSTTSLTIVNNAQSQKAVDSLGRDALEFVISDIDYFENPRSVTVNDPSDADGYGVVAGAATCLREDPALGYSAKWPLAPRDTTWEVVSTVSDDVSGAGAVVHQGLRIRMTAGSCP